MSTGNGNNGKVIGLGIDPRAEMMRQAQEAQQRQETMAAVNICTQIVCNRDKMIGEHGSAHSVEILQHADRLLLSWVKGLSEEHK